MTETPAPRPTPGAVVELVVRLLGSNWPRTEADRVAWFERFRLAADPTAPGTSTDSDERSASYRTSGPALWDGTPIGWHSFDDEFVGVHWFLWNGLPREDLQVAAVDLRAGFRRACGSAMGEADHPDQGFSAWWRAGGRTVDMYYHPGIRPPGTPEGTRIGACVQLHVDHTVRADAAEAVASARCDEAPPRQMCGPGGASSYER